MDLAAQANPLYGATDNQYQPMVPGTQTPQQDVQQAPPQQDFYDNMARMNQPPLVVSSIITLSNNCILE